MLCFAYCSISLLPLSSALHLRHKSKKWIIGQNQNPLNHKSHPTTKNCLVCTLYLLLTQRILWWTLSSSPEVLLVSELVDGYIFPHLLLQLLGLSVLQTVLKLYTRNFGILICISLRLLVHIGRSSAFKNTVA